MLAGAVIDQAYRDLVNLTGAKPETRFNPGPATSQNKLSTERAKLHAFLSSEDFIVWATLAGMKESDREQRRCDWLNVLNEYEDGKTQKEEHEGDTQPRP